jgi:hypothetical protein
MNKTSCFFHEERPAILLADREETASNSAPSLGDSVAHQS